MIKVKTKKKFLNASQIILLAFLIVLCIIWLFPLYFILMTAFTPEGIFEEYKKRIKAKWLISQIRY